MKARHDLIEYGRERAIRETHYNSKYTMISDHEAAVVWCWRQTEVGS